MRLRLVAGTAGVVATVAAILVGPSPGAPARLASCDITQPNSPEGNRHDPRRR
jgi:hypothetical protein